MPSELNKMYNKLKDQVLIIQALNEKIASEFIDMNSDTKKRYSEFSKMKCDINDMKSVINYIRKMCTHMMSQKHHSLTYKMDPPNARDTFTSFPAKN